MTKHEIIEWLNETIEFVDEWHESRERSGFGELPEGVECAIQKVVQLRDRLEKEIGGQR